MRGAAEKTELIEWWDAMDTLLGVNGRVQDIAKGLRMARACRHEDSKLCALFPEDKPVPSKEEMKQVFLALGEDRRALFFAGMIAGRDLGLVRRSAELGYAPAQAFVASCCQGREQFEWASKASAQTDRAGLYQLAVCWLNGMACSRDDVKAVQLFKEGAELDHTLAQFCYGQYAFHGNNWNRYFWWGRAAAKCNVSAPTSLAEAAAKYLKLFENGMGSGRVLFGIGAACRGHLREGIAFGSEMHADFVNAMKRAVALHDEWCEDTKRAVCCWTWCAKELGVVKDVRLCIAKMLWAERVAWVPLSERKKDVRSAALVR